MSSNYAVKREELRTVNDELYGSSKMGLITPIVNGMVAAGNDVDYYDGKLRNQNKVDVDWVLGQSFPTESAILKYRTKTDNEHHQLTAHTKEFEYKRRALTAEMVYSTLEDAKKVNPRQQAIRESWKQYDYLSYHGFFGNYGVSNNPKLITTENQDIDSVSALNGTIRGVMDTYFRPLGWNDSMMSMITLNMTSDIAAFLTAASVGNTALDQTIFNNALKGTNGQEARQQVMQPYLLANQTVKTKIDLCINTMLKHHHGAVPSLYNSGEVDRNDEEWDRFAMETAALEVEEHGALVSVPITITGAAAVRIKAHQAFLTKFDN
jgi:hypothetical protein